MNPIFRGFESLAERVNEVVGFRLWHIEKATDTVDEVVDRRYPAEVVTPAAPVPETPAETLQPKVTNVVSMVQQEGDLSQAEALVAAAYEQAPPSVGNDVESLADFRAAKAKAEAEALNMEGNYDQKAA